MQVERLGQNKIRIFITFEDLDERGINRDEIWQNGGKVQELFWEMMETAYEEVGFEVVGPIAVEAFTMPSEGVVVIVTQVASLPVPIQQEVESTDLVPVQSSEEGTIGTFIFSFEDFENLLACAMMLDPFVLDGVSLYSYKNRYFLVFENAAIIDDRYDDVWALLQEYGRASSTTTAVLQEYGKQIMEDHAIRRLVAYFDPNQPK